jgi:PAS domain S-box-containing protein
VVATLGDVDPVQLRAVQESLLDPSLILQATRDIDGVIIDFVCEDANEAAGASLEVPLHDLIGAQLTRTVSESLAMFLLEQCTEAVETGEPLVFDDLRIPDEGGGIIAHYDVRAVAVGERVCFSWRDVTERFRNEQALAMSRNRYRLLAENSSDVVVLVDPDGTIEWVSPSIRDMLGWEPEEIVGRQSSDFVFADDRHLRAAVHSHPATVRQSTDEVRFRCAGGSYLWVSARMREVSDSDGHLASVVVSIRDVHKQVQARKALVTSEERYRLLAENSSDVVYQGVNGRITWISPSVERVLGWKPSELIGHQSTDIIAPEDIDRVMATRAGVQAGRPLDRFECRFLTASGQRRWMSAHAQRVTTGEPGSISMVAGLQDIHQGHANRLALAALDSVNSALVVAADEDRIESDICRLVVEVGGFARARYERGDAMATEGTAHVDAGSDTTDPAGSPEGMSIELPVAVDGVVDGVLTVWSFEPEALGHSVVATLEQMAHQMGMALSRVRTREQLVEALNEQQLLSTAIEQTGESVIVTDIHSTILYANPATEVTTGYSLEEIIGSNPRMFASGLHSTEFFRDIGTTLLQGRTWRGVIVNRNRSGELYEEDSSITPVRGEDGEITCFVCVLRNLGRERELEADLDRLRSDRDSVVRVMADVRVGATVESTVASFCKAATRLEDIGEARVLLIDPGGEVVPLGTTGPLFVIWEVGVPLDFEHLDDLVEVTRAGPWWLPLAGPVGEGLVLPEVVTSLHDAGIVSVGFAPIWWESRMVGILIVGSQTKENDRWAEARTAVLDQLGSFAGSLLGAQAGRRGVRAQRRAAIRSIIDTHAFRPVFQPVIDLSTDEVLGYEALTRFADARRPDLVFEEAHAVGLGIELETACASAAVIDAADLPPGVWLALNFSPATVVSGEMATVVRRADRPVVVEITEHVEVESYGAVRDAARACPGVRISVDDAGAGYASLRHILELQPDFVKLDIDLVHNIDTDPARQALAAGLHHYAEETGTTLIAEGVESVEERAAIEHLGIRLGQGYLFGRPASLTGSPDASVG